MGKKLMAVEVRGHIKVWSFHFYGDPSHVKTWEADGLKIYVIENTVPAWIAGLGLTRAWCFMQDIFNLKNPLR